MKPRVVLSDEMKKLANRGHSQGRSLDNYGDYLCYFWVDGWRDGCGLEERINNAGLKAVYKELADLALLVDTVKATVMAARRQLRIDAKEVYATDLFNRVKDMLVDHGCRTRLDVLYCSGYELRRMKGFGIGAECDWSDWCDCYRQTDYDADRVEDDKRREKIFAELRAKYPEEAKT